MEQYLEKQLHCLCRSVRAADERAVDAAKRHWNGIAKPLYGLGRFEDLLTKVAGIQNTEDIKIDRKAVVVFCAYNGVVAEGVTQTDSSVTAVVTENFARGIASVNRMASVAGADVIPVDIGIMGEIKEPGVRNCRIANGTSNLRREPAMSREQALEALHTGIRLASELKDTGYDLLAVGEMGIGNTTTSSAVASVLLQAPVEIVTGRGAGLSNAGLEKKIEVIKEAIALHHPDPEDPLAVLEAVGGFDIAGMCGLMLGGANLPDPGGTGWPDLVDGSASGPEILSAGYGLSASVPYGKGTGLRHGNGNAWAGGKYLWKPGTGRGNRSRDAVSAA